MCIRILGYIILICTSILVSCKNEEIFDATGVFESTEIVVSSEANGKIISFELEEGSKVVMDETLGIVDTVQLYLRKCQLEANMKSVLNQRPDIGKQIAATKEQIAKAETERKRVENLFKLNAANKKQLDDWDSQLAVLRKQLEAQISSLSNTDNSLSEQAQSVAIQIAQLDDQLNKCRIVSPVSGTVLAKYAEKGEMTAIGKPLFKVADLENIYIRTYITSSQLAKVNIGGEAFVFADSAKGDKREYKGKVIWVADEAEFTPKTILTSDERANLVYAVKIAVKNDGYIKLGMYGEVKFP